MSVPLRMHALVTAFGMAVGTMWGYEITGKYTLKNALIGGGLSATASYIYGLRNDEDDRNGGRPAFPETPDGTPPDLKEIPGILEFHDGRWVIPTPTHAV
jgi:hypothetical protein